MDNHTKKELLESFRNSTPFYREKLDGINDFEKVPFTTKKDLLNSQLKMPPYGNFTDYNHTIDQVYRTSGTTNVPLLVTFTNDDIELVTSIGKDCFRHSGMGAIGNQEIVINCLNLSMWAGGFLDSQSIMRTGAQTINFGTGHTIELINLIKYLGNSYKVSLHCTPSYLPAIEHKLNETFNTTPDKLNLHHLYLGAEGGVQNNDFRQCLMDKWNCKVYNANYGMSEVCSIMASASDDNVLKISDLFLKNYYIELIDTKCNPTDKLTEGLTGDLVATSLKKQSQPIFRYLTNETICIKKIHNGSIYIEITGRTDDMIVFKGINFFPEQLRSIIVQFKELSGIYKVQAKKVNDIIQSINVVCEIREVEAGQEDVLIKQIINKIQAELTVKPSITLTNKIEVTGNKLKIIEYL